jgi:hypothetical protein
MHSTLEQQQLNPATLYDEARPIIAMNKRTDLHHSQQLPVAVFHGHSQQIAGDKP